MKRGLSNNIYIFNKAFDPEMFKGRLITRTGATWATIIVSLVAIVRALLEGRQ